MPSLRPSVSQGGSVSALLRSASSVASTIQSIQDKAAADAWATSAYSDDAYKTYSDYLNRRISTLSTTSAPTDVLKSMTLTDTLRSATKQNTSATITRENIQVMAGNAKLVDKYNVIAGQYVRAVGNGDLTLAQSLMSQAYSVNQSIQYQAQQAQDAATTLAKASGTKTAKGYTDVATSLEKDLVAFNNQYVHAGQKSADKALQTFVDSKKDQLTKLGIILQPGVKPNYFDVVSGVNQAVFQAYNLAGDAAAPYAADGGQSYYDKAANSVSKIPTAYGTMSAVELQNAAANPNNFSYNTSPDYVGQKQGGAGGKQNPQVGYRYDAKTGVQPVIAQTPWITVPKDVLTQVSALHLEIVGDKLESGQGYTVHATKDTPQYIKDVLPGNSTTAILANPQYDTNGKPSGYLLQFEADSKTGQGKAVYTVTKDSKGKTALWESSNLGDRLLGSDPNFNTGQYKDKGGKWVNFTPQGSVNSVKGPHLSLSSDFTGVNQLISQAQQQQAVTDAATLAAAKAMLPTSIPALPSIAPPTMVAPPSVAPAVPSAAKLVYPSGQIQKPTVNPQQPTVAPGVPGSINLQGAGAGSIKL